MIKNRLISNKMKALWLRIIFKPLMMPKRAIKIKKEHKQSKSLLQSSQEQEPLWSWQPRIPDAMAQGLPAEETLQPGKRSLSVGSNEGNALQQRPQTG